MCIDVKSKSSSMSTNYQVGYCDPTQMKAVFELQAPIRKCLNHLHIALLALDTDIVYELAVATNTHAPLQFNGDTLKTLGFTVNDNFIKVFSLLLEKGKTEQDRNDAVNLFPQSLEHCS